MILREPAGNAPDECMVSLTVVSFAVKIAPQDSRFDGCVRGIHHARTHSVRTSSAHTVTFATTAVAPVRYAIQRRQEKSQKRSARDRKLEARYVYLVRSPDPTIFDAKNAVNIVERARGHVVIATCADNREISRSRGLDIAVSPRSYVRKR